jgi:exonuclease V gamma subunit
MNNFYIKHLPHWVLTDLQPAFYDVESGTTLQQTAKIYGKMQELIDLYNEFVTKVNKYIKDFEDGIIEDFEEFRNCIIKVMNDYIETIDTKINLQDTKINDAIEYMKDNIVSTTSELFSQALQDGDIRASLVENYNPTTEELTLSIQAEGGE